MNLIMLKVELEEQIKIYKDFIPFTENNTSMFKLMREIYNLSLRVEKLKQLTFNDLICKGQFTHVYNNSRINNKSNNLDKKIYY